MYFKLLWNEFATLPEVEAIALGGSRAGADYDEKSDYDLYIYCTRIPYESMRKCILEKCCQYIELGNSFWELEDDCTLKDGVDIDILYRNIEDSELKKLRNALEIVISNLIFFFGCLT
ncbi:MAG: nucleotidyltransferase domain-containing protein [Lachnospiraceae bacterium]|nr:nucleotidyltransferase domain-containing protein [Lachnospiraceae bacterium]